MLYNAIKKTIRTISGMSDYCLDLQHITADDTHTLLDSVINTDFYCLKEIKVNRRNGHYDSSVRRRTTLQTFLKDNIIRIFLTYFGYQTILFLYPRNFL